MIRLLGNSIIFTTQIYILGWLFYFMPPKGVKSKKRERQYEHIKKSELRMGRPLKTAKRIAAATTNKTRRIKGELKKK